MNTVKSLALYQLTSFPNAFELILKTIWPHLTTPLDNHLNVYHVCVCMHASVYMCVCMYVCWECNVICHHSFSCPLSLWIFRIAVEVTLEHCFVCVRSNVFWEIGVICDDSFECPLYVWLCRVAVYVEATLEHSSSCAFISKFGKKLTLHYSNTTVLLTSYS